MSASSTFSFSWHYLSIKLALCKRQYWQNLNVIYILLTVKITTVDFKRKTLTIKLRIRYRSDNVPYKTASSSRVHKSLLSMINKEVNFTVYSYYIRNSIYGSFFRHSFVLVHSKINTIITEQKKNTISAHCVNYDLRQCIVVAFNRKRTPIMP
jgi:hypothetical protein